MKYKGFLVALMAVVTMGLCLGLVVAFGTAPAADPAQDSRPGDEHLLFEKNERGDAYTVTGLDEGCTDTTIVVPAVHEGLPVTAIGQEAFLYGTMTEVVLPDSVKRIERFAFAGCYGLKRVDFGNGLEVIGVQAFDACEALEHVDFPASLREIDGYAFEYSGLKAVTIPGGVIRIGQMAFYACESLTQVEFEEGLKSIGTFAFAYISAEEIVVPDSVTDLGEVCFAYNPRLKQITFGWGCTGISYGTCFRCTALETVIISDVCGVTDTAFGDCTALRRVYFGLDEEAWETSCSVGTESDDNPINGYGNTYFREADLYFYSEEPIYDGAHWRYDAEGNAAVWEQPVASDAHLLFEKNETGDAYTVTGLDESCTDTTIVIPAVYDGLPVTAIGKNAFLQRTHIEEVVLPSEIVEIGYGAFDACSGLTAINFPKRLRTIGDYAFYECTALKEAQLPVSLRTLGCAAFFSCTALERAFLPKSAVLDAGVFYACTSLSEVTLEEGFDGLVVKTFEGCTSLCAIELPESLTRIDAYAFAQSGLNEVVIPNGVGTIGMGAFSGCASLENVTLQAGLHEIGPYAFQSTALKEVVIPEEVYAIGMQAFAFNAALEHVVLGPNLGSCGYGAFAMCPALKTVTIVNLEGLISDSAFGGCTGLEAVYFYDDAEAWEAFRDERIGNESNENPQNGYGNAYLYHVENVYFYSEEPNPDGRHWHFGEDGKPQLWA